MRLPLTVSLLIVLLGMALAADGEALYRQNCLACHQENGQGVPVAFPPLAGNPDLADEAHVLETIRTGLSGPITVLGQDYNGVMPPFAQLSDEEVQALATYIRGAWGNRLASESAKTPTVPAGETAVSTATLAIIGNAAQGERYFLGFSRFQNGGSPCVACHNVPGLGLLGGGDLAKGQVSATGDLSTVVARYGVGGLNTMLDNPPFRVMRHIYADKAFTAQEKDDLIAFFSSLGDTAITNKPAYSRRMWLIGAFGAALLFGLLGLGWGRQRSSFGERLRAKRSQA